MASTPAPRANPSGGRPCRRRGAGRPRDQPGQSVLEDGARVPAGTSLRLACDAEPGRDVRGRGGRPPHGDWGAGPGRSRRRVRRALQHRDRGCRFPGCAVRFGQGHHLRHWAQGGPTTLLQPRPPLSAAPPRRARGGLPGRSRTRWRPALPPAGRAARARGATAAPGACRPGPGASGAPRGTGAPPAPAHGVPERGSAPGSRLGDRRRASAGGARCMSVSARPEAAVDGLITPAGVGTQTASTASSAPRPARAGNNGARARWHERWPAVRWAKNTVVQINLQFSTVISGP